MADETPALPPLADPLSELLARFTTAAREVTLGRTGIDEVLGLLFAARAERDALREDVAREIGLRDSEGSDYSARLVKATEEREAAMARLAALEAETVRMKAAVHLPAQAAELRVKVETLRERVRQARRDDCLSLGALETIESMLDAILRLVPVAHSDAQGGTTAAPQSLTLRALRNANERRQREWDKAGGIDASYRGNELAGEVGEACNVIKKLERERLGIRGSRATVAQLAEELADVVICVDLIAQHYEVDLGEAVVAKFNATSEKVGLSTRLAEATP